MSMLSGAKAKPFQIGERLLIKKSLRAARGTWGALQRPPARADSSLLLVMNTLTTERSIEKVNY